MSKAYRIYLDVCCLNRPFDDLSQDRIRLEAEAVLLIYKKCRIREWTLLSSEAIESELRQTPDPSRIKLILGGLAIASEKALMNNALRQRASEFLALGFKPFDAIHIASAEAVEADVFLSTDDRLVRRANRSLVLRTMLISNPVHWLMSLSSIQGDNNDSN